jgi:HlyD family secretion protein
MTGPTTPTGKVSSRLFSSWIFRGAVALFVVSVLVAVAFRFSGGNADYGLTFAVRKGPLDIKVLEGGDVESLNSQEVKSEVAGWQGTKILTIVEEGYEITEADVANKTLLVELDSSEFQKELTEAQITFKGTEASLTEAQQGYEIQINQSESDIYEAELEVKLAKLELEKYLGAEVTNTVLSQLDLFQSNWEKEREAAIAAAEANDAEAEPEGGGDIAVAAEPEPAAPAEKADAIEMTLEDLRMTQPTIPWIEYAESEILGDGEANQLMRTNEDELLLARKELGTSRQQLEGTKRLFDKGYVTQIELENDQTDLDKKEISVKAAETKQSVFINYEFPKQSETLLSKYVQAIRKLERAEKKALSEIAKARGTLASARARHLIEQNRIKEYQDNIDKCKMYAEHPGLVVYGGSNDRYWDDEQIKEGATVRERQTIITIPDMASMAVKVKIHEAEIEKVKVGQKVAITVDAHRDRPLAGVVSKVSVLPDSENRWMNPDLKVYETEIRIEGVHNWLKPGMSAETEILIDRLDDVLYIPVQSVVPDGNEQVCFVANGGEPERRVVTTGPVTVEYIVIESGLEAGEEVLIRPPDGARRDVKDEDASSEDETEDDGSTEPEVVGQG